ncbi:MAG: sigma-54-dependent Fis family transcriptional regulator, partial [SAR324 cluster bacterium]|nr:sigma-54-dependent Fis family transcriptional regulator [SAR324 cluster bacterium]
KGAFTSASESRMGHFELADGGTLFLDEIGELSLPVQVKLLRFLQDHEFYRLGRTKPTRVDVRLVTATNRSLEDLIKEKKFRQDLYYRIHVVNLSLPPLRDRYEDIPTLSKHFIEKFSNAYDGRTLEITPEAMDIMIQYEWPGNVRELENVIESLIALNPTEEVKPEDLPPKLHSHPGSTSRRSPVFEGSLHFEDAERKFETEMIVKALKKTNFVQTKAAELLGISRRILKYKMDKLGISESVLEGLASEKERLN